MNFIDFVFFFYIFVGLYMLSLFIFIYVPNRKNMFSYPKGYPEPVSIIVPCYNDQDHIGETIESLLNLEYPKDMIEIIVVDDKSKDNSVSVIKKYAEKHSNVKLIVNKVNSGGAAEPTNIGIRAAKYNYIAVTDSDSSPEKDNLLKMIGFLQTDSKVAAVTCSVMAQKPKKFMQKLQAMEYKVIGFNRKLLDCIDSVYVTPGPFALYRKKVLIDVGLFDTKNMTQDIEIVWRLLSNGYKARMSLSAKVYSITPEKFRDWWKQRVRWNIGGTQCLLKYRKTIFKNGMLGGFIIPFFSFSLFLGLFGLGLFLYLISKRFLLSYLLTKYSLYAGTEVFRLQDLTFEPSILNFFGVVLFLFSLGFSLFCLSKANNGKSNDNLFNVLFYVIVYLSIYPLIMVTSLYKLSRKTYSW